MKTVSIGKLRGLQQCASPRGRLTCLALDHRQNLRRSLNPTNPNAVPDSVLTEASQNSWSEACAEISAASSVPWILLSAAVDFDTYLHQVTTACKAGASGIAVERVVWKEAVTMEHAKRNTFLNTIAAERLSRLTALCDTFAKPWTDFSTAWNVDGWYKSYEE